MKLNLNQQFVNLKGEPLPTKMDETLANMLAMASTGNPAKMITWAVNLTNDGEIEVDKADAKFLTELIEKSLYINNLAKAQLLEEIDKLTLKQVEVKENEKISLEDLERDLERKVKRLP